jgi:hypothetical protein
MIECDHDGCDKEADIVFRDGSKPTTLLLCHIHGYEMYEYYNRIGMLFSIRKLQND